ncbi:hypothetical protein CK203_040046 [Vitis vinifera]|uniref:DUF4283 domain-containing protein n=1 Tax=Vitis vinifera TaxID=29760 RepID=A0A438IDW4_VITVI|nr:hypothetical protein CK203_040046 [Vitis vinifera]
MPPPSGPSTSHSGPTTSPSGPTTSPSTVAAQSMVTVDVPATKVETPPATDVKDDIEKKNEQNKYADVLLVLVVKLSVDGFPLVNCKPMGLEAFVEIAMKEFVDFQGDVGIHWRMWDRIGFLPPIGCFSLKSSGGLISLSCIPFSFLNENFCSYGDVSPEETLQESPFENFEESTETSSSKDAQFSAGVSQNGTPPRPGMGVSEDSQSTLPVPYRIPGVDSLRLRAGGFCCFVIVRPLSPRILPVCFAAFAFANILICSHKNLAMQGGKDWFRVESKSFKILVEVVKGKGWKNAISRWQGSPLGSFERREKGTSWSFATMSQGLEYFVLEVKKAWVNPSSSVVDGPLGDKFSDVVCGLMVPNKVNSWSLEGNVLLVRLGGMPVMFEFELSSYAEKALQSGMRVPIKTNGSMVLRMLHVVIKNREDSSKRDEGFKGKPLFLDRWSSKVGCFSKGVDAREAWTKCDNEEPLSLVVLWRWRLDSRENTMEGTLEGNHNSVGEPLKMNYLHRCSMEFLNNVVKSSRGFEEVAREELALK